ncbi:MAG TPA: glutamate--tRNA ligase [Candidatus Limnocylindrales bacterium]|nr:glutamate--tRNA ligase [Candidatus Limnocylindrales bacterium]
MQAIRTRFAPSPTGHLHIGGARTALFNYLHARRHSGHFVLRIEDSDRERSTEEFTRSILEALSWLGLSYDEGPYYQSRRGDYYEQVIDRLLASGHAYHCLCTPEELEAKRQAAQAAGRTPAYDRTCRDAGHQPVAGRRSVVRLKVPLDGQTIMTDVIRGVIAFENRELDDFVIVRSDGSPMFHLVNVADDIDMGITHILRGEDHITNTPRQMQIFAALGARPPVYGHMPLIVGQDRTRLSKRHGATSVLAYRDAGFLPEATINYLARLGWSHGDQEVFTRQELIELFDPAGINKAAAAWDIEKYSWVNAQHMRALGLEELTRHVRPILAERGHGGRDEGWLEQAVALVRERARTLVELADQLEPLVRDEIEYDAKAAEKFLGEGERARLLALCDRLQTLEPWEAPGIEGVFRAVCEEQGIKLGALAQPARVALTGATASPGIFELCAVLGRERTASRIRSACDAAASGGLRTRPAGALGSSDAAG